MFDDQETRQRVVSEHTSFIVQAPAGSGKTELLTQRFLNLLANVDQPERVLAITFTRKATQEMRERIMLRLRQAAQGHQTSQVHEQLAISLAAKVLQSSTRYDWNLLENPGRLQIHTIDGLCARVSGRSPQAGTGITGLQVLEDARPLYLKAARRLIEDLGQESADSAFFASLSRVLIYLKVSAADLQEMLSSMLGRRDQWLSNLGARPEQMKDLLAEQQLLELQILRDALGEQSINDLSAALEQMAGLSGDTQSAQRLLSSLQDERRDKSDPDLAIKATFQILKIVATAANRPFAPSSANKKVLARADGERSDQLDCLKQILTGWQGNELASGAFHRFLSNPPLVPADDAWLVLSDFQLLLKYASAELRVLFVEESKADFIYVAEMALQALGGELFPGDALLMEDGSLSHILLDEFQDTSHLQYELIRKLVSGWQPGDGRSLFLVGDPMQSIYRFRKADVSLFTNVFENGFLGCVPLESLQLTSNFRSAPEIIHWVNDHFPNVFKQTKQHSANFVAYTPVTAVREEHGKVCAHPYHHEIGVEGEANLVAELIRDQRDAEKGASIAVLARARVQLEPIAAALNSLNVGFEAVQVEDLSSRPVIADLMTILRALIHPADRIAWLSILRGPWCALDPHELLLIAGGHANDDIFNRLSNPDLIKELPTEKQARLQMIFELMASALTARDHMRVSRIVEVVWLRLKGAYVVGSIDELDNAALFFKLLSRIEEEQPEDLLTAVFEKMNNFYSSSKHSNVKLMTIHKAKGLEFDHVILPGLQRAKYRGDTPLLRIQELQLADVSNDSVPVLMAPRRKRLRSEPGLYDYLGLLESEQQSLELCRVLYVAATRAKKQLHLFGGWKWNKKEQRPDCDKGSFLSLLWPFFETHIAVSQAPEVNVKSNEALPSQLPQLILANEPDLVCEAIVQNPEVELPELRVPDPDNIALGQAFHIWMQLIHDHWEQGWSKDWFEQNRPALKSTLHMAGASEHKLDELVLNLSEMILSALSDPNSREMISPEAKGGSWAELAFVSRDGVRMQRHILDLMYVDDAGDAHIVDYKTGSLSDESISGWEDQLSRYKDIVTRTTGVKVEDAQIYHAQLSSK